MLLVVVGQRSRLRRFIGNERRAFLAQPQNSLSGTKRYKRKHTMPQSVATKSTFMPRRSRRSAMTSPHALVYGKSCGSRRRRPISSEPGSPGARSCPRSPDCSCQWRSWSARADDGEGSGMLRAFRLSALPQKLDNSASSWGCPPGPSTKLRIASRQSARGISIDGRLGELDGSLKRQSAHFDWLLCFL